MSTALPPLAPAQTAGHYPLAHIWIEIIVEVFSRQPILAPEHRDAVPYKSRHRQVDRSRVSRINA